MIHQSRQRPVFSPIATILSAPSGSSHGSALASAQARAARRHVPRWLSGLPASRSDGRGDREGKGTGEFGSGLPQNVYLLP
jgi:hypothetical protein